VLAKSEQTVCLYSPTDLTHCLRDLPPVAPRLSHPLRVPMPVAQQGAPAAGPEPARRSKASGTCCLLPSVARWKPQTWGSSTDLHWTSSPFASTGRHHPARGAKRRTQGMAGRAAAQRHGNPLGQESSLHRLQNPTASQKTACTSHLPVRAIFLFLPFVNFCLDLIKDFFPSFPHP